MKKLINPVKSQIRVHAKKINYRLDKIFRFEELFTFTKSLLKPQNFETKARL